MRSMPGVSICAATLAACGSCQYLPRASQAEGKEPSCVLVRGDSFGPEGTAKVRAETVAEGLEVPWGIAWLPNGDALVTERPGRVRLLTQGKLAPTAVATVPVTHASEHGLLGIAVHPLFEENRFFYLYGTFQEGRNKVNRVERWRLSRDAASAERERVIFDGIGAASYHDGGRISFGPDGMLYVGTGDAREPDSAQDPKSPNGKLLRLTPDGAVPEDNPSKGSPVFLSGIRNTQGWDWPDAKNAKLIWLTDHGPSGELGRSGHDEVNAARAGDNLGWPAIYGCERKKGMVAPALTWETAVPPGGAAVAHSDAIPEWRGALVVGTLRSEHLHVVHFTGDRVARHEVYFRGRFGRLRDVAQGPDGHLYVTTSNCDSRGDCGPAKDRILRIVRAQ
jgi:glucose/arabinose dehydrogenase